jgi:hypothetical protein
MHGYNAILSICSLITRFLSISKTTTLHYDTPHIRSNGSMKTRFLSINKITPLALPHKPYLSVWQSENAILLNQQMIYLYEGTTYI